MGANYNSIIKKYRINIYFTKITKYIKTISDNDFFKINNNRAQYNIIYKKISQLVLKYFLKNYYIFII